MKLEKNEIEILVAILEKKIKDMKEEEATILRPGIQFLSAEEKYEQFLEKLLEKLKNAR